MGPESGLGGVAQCCAGLRVIDASRVLAGPYCATLLADLGAEVIRVEHPVQADEVRNWAPKVDGISAAFIAMNHSKRSVGLDIAHADGAAVFRTLLGTADVLIENYRPGTLERWGFDRAALLAINKRLIHCSVRAFPTGHSRERLPGYEAAIQAFSGIMSLTGEADRDPVRAGPSIVDLGTGMAATIAILAALRTREQTGAGGYMEPALLRTATNLMAYQMSGLSYAGVVPQRRGSGHEALVPYGVFRAKDGPAFIAAGNDKLWALAARVLGIGEAGAPPYPDLPSRIANRAAVEALVHTAASTWSRADLLLALTQAGVPATPVQTLDEYGADPTLLSSGVLQALDVAGHTVAVAGPLFGGDPAPPLRHAPPAVGEHTDAVLETLGFDAAQRERMRAAGAIR